MKTPGSIGILLLAVFLTVPVTDGYDGYAIADTHTNMTAATAVLHGLEPETLYTCPHASLKGKRYYSCSHLGHNRPAVSVPERFSMCDNSTNCVKRLKPSTIWFLGDSLSTEFAIALRCLLYEAVGTGDVSVIGEGRKGKFSGLTSVFKHSCVTFRAIQVKVCNIKITPHYSSSRFGCGNGFNCLAKLVRPNDSVIINFGVWYNTQAVNQLSRDLKNLQVNLMGLRKKYPDVRWIWWDTTAQHFPSVGGRYVATPSGAPAPILCKLWNRTDLNEERLARTHLDITDPVISKLGIQKIPSWELTAAINPFLHPGGGDCTHWCLNGVPVVLAKILLSILSRGL